MCGRAQAAAGELVRWLDFASIDGKTWGVIDSALPSVWRGIKGVVSREGEEFR